MADGINVGGSGGPPTTPNPSAQVGRIDRAGYPDQPKSAQASIPPTLENFRYLVEASNIKVRFNVVKKRAEIDVPGLRIDRQNRDAVILSHLESLLIRNDMSPGPARQYVLVLADANPLDPFADWVNSKPWDGESRLRDICDTIVATDEYPVAFRDVLVRKWLLSIVAATFKPQGFRARGVLTLQGAQGLGKTSWIARLVTPPELCEDVVKLGHSWDGGSKDARLAALRHRIVELGELEGSFRREMAGLKAFITETDDKIRPPYARVEAEYRRSTIFAASVNDRQFLLDTTGNSRFWTIPVQRIDYQHGIDMQQVFAELKAAYERGDQWWLTGSEEEQLAKVNQEHRLMSAIEAKITEALDLDRIGQDGLPRLTATEVLKLLGVERPTNGQSKEANVALRAALGEPKKVKGYYRWRVPWRREEPSAQAYNPAQDIY
ncbi:VapE domain-containing protein [Erythrobacter sp.]|uniref:VapE domain-containing protein n=1 Tax=Erythrobacter sp. TaxID=1042 RepID=UPI0025CE07BF|nr:VapE domain-containing protein [Erythrobacter sp.]